MSITILMLVLGAQAPDATTLFEAAQKDAREGRYGEAQAAYKRIAKEFPDTEEGRRAATRAQPSAFLGWKDVLRQGPSSNRVDVVLMGDGYELSHLRAFDKLAEDTPALFERKEPFHEYWSYFNWTRASLVSADNGVDGFGREYDTVLDSKTLSTFAGHVGVNAARVREMLDELPEHDGLAICFVKNGVAGMGGSGFAVIGGRDASTTIHEWGHSFGGLGDEYDVEIAAHTGSVPDAPNVSGTDDPKRVPWAHWLAAKHPRIGIYEGAAARLRGAWKPTSAGCVMATQEEFCPVCREALVLRTYAYVDPIESSEPAHDPQARSVRRLGLEPLELRVKAMRPASHVLEARWWIQPASLPELTGPSDEVNGSLATSATPRVVDRTGRGPLPPIAEKPTKESLYDTDAEHKLLIRPNDLKPGIYRVVCRVKDTTEMRGERYPWVLKDALGLLESERVWWIEVPAR
ncbi:MAG TPA: M64 family metallopeptidase [Planctomycetota bacterium]|nr:M64 family metallopeptidase [Planctomycetota bacterium]